MRRILSPVKISTRAFRGPGAGVLILGLVLPSLGGAQAVSSNQCLASDTTNLMYVDTNGCSPSLTGQPTPPPDSNGQSWLSPSYNNASVPGWSDAVSVNYADVGNWAAPCSIAGSGSGEWIGWDGNGDNPCGTTSPNVANLYFLKSFNVPSGCSVTQATLQFLVDNAGYVWLNGQPVVSDSGAYNACTQVTVSTSDFQTGTNVLEIEDINQPLPAGYLNPEGFDYDFCYTLSCVAAPTPSATPTATPTVPVTPSVPSTPTPTPTSCADQFFVDKNVFRPSNQEKVDISVATCAYPGNVFVRIYNSAGEHIRTLRSENTSSGLQNTYSWDGTNKYGNTCASGVYIILFEDPLGSHAARVVLVR